jgi:hypothetical protein
MKTDLTAFSAGTIKVKYRLFKRTIHEYKYDSLLRKIEIGLILLAVVLLLVNWKISALLACVWILSFLILSNYRPTYTDEDLDRFLHFTQKEMEIRNAAGELFETWNYKSIGKIYLDPLEFHAGAGYHVVGYEDFLKYSELFELRIKHKEESIKILVHNKMHLTEEDLLQFKSPEPQFCWIIRTVCSEERIPIFTWEKRRNLDAWDGGFA